MTEVTELTAEDIRQQLEELETTLATMRARKDEIEGLIAGAFSTTAPKLEAEYSSLNVRLLASDKVRERLQQQLIAAARVELFADIDAKMSEAHAAYQRMAEIETEQNELYARIAQLNKEYEPLKPIATTASNSYYGGKLSKRAEALGITAAEIMARKKRLPGIANYWSV